MSNIHSPSAAHGVDDEFNYGQPNRCLLCWSRAKDTFFAAPPRKGRTLRMVYAEHFDNAHNQGNSH